MRFQLFSAWQWCGHPFIGRGLFFFLFLTSIASFAQINSSNNIANYDYFLGKGEKADDALQAQIDQALKKHDSLVFDEQTHTYRKYTIVDGKPTLVYEGNSIKNILQTEGKAAEQKYIDQKYHAMDKLFEFRVPSLYAERSLYHRIFQNSYVDAPELKGHIQNLVEETGKTLAEIKSLRYKKLRNILPSLLVGFGGTFSVQAGYRIQEVRNLSLPQSLRVVGSPDFQVNMNINGDVSLSNKLILPALSLNTLSNFDQEIFKARLTYKGSSEEILKEVSIIQTNFDTKSSLIPSTESLLGANVKVQFGRLFLTGAIGQVRGQIQTTNVSTGKSKTPFRLRASDYDEHQHYFLSQYFYNNYENALRNLPAVLSGIRVTRVEVWVTNRQNKTQSVRQALAFMDLAEPNPYHPSLRSNVSDDYPRNAANTLFPALVATEDYRDASKNDQLLGTMGLTMSRDYEKSFMRLLNPTEYRLNAELGYIMLRTPLQADEVLAVAYEYSINGTLYQVGEFSNEKTPQASSAANTTQPNHPDYTTATIFLKLLKATVTNVHLPLWNLMMKNVYSIGSAGTKREDLSFQILYDQQGGVSKNYIPSSGVRPEYKTTSLLQITGMDRLGAVPTAAGRDGEFDFIENVTFIPELGKIVFPSKRPFGKDIRYVFQDMNEADKFLFDVLYDTLKEIAKTYTVLDRFTIAGYNSGGMNSNGVINIGFNLSPGSIRIYSGSYLLVENQDYFADYALGTARIINPTYLNSQVPLQVQFENSNQFNFRNYLLMGLRWDYYFKNKKWVLGGTLVNLNETPFYRKLEYSLDPINNSAFQVDLKFKDEMPWLSKAFGIFPGVDKKQTSTIKAQTEVAMLVPGHSSQIGKGAQGGIYIDDFESVRSAIDIKSSFMKWTLASTPETNNNLFPEALSRNDFSYGYNRARLSWYIIDPTYQDIERVDNPLVGQYDELSKSEVRQVYLSELFPNRSRDAFQDRMSTFDLTFYPHERGPYNFDTKLSEFNPNGSFKNPEKKWGGIMRALTQIDFVSTNVQYLEFWLLDPFVNKPQSTGGEMYIQLGNISEDILKDGNKSFENGLPTPTAPAAVGHSKWAKYPQNPTQISFGFTNDPSDRPFQDLGFDGYSTTEERDTLRSFLNDIMQQFGASSPIYAQLFRDPASDDYRHYAVVTDELGNQTSILQRYKYISNPEGNTPVATSSNIRGSFMPPESEDLNNDNVLNQLEAHYQYNLLFRPNMSVGTNHIADIKSVSVSLPNGTSRTEKWYLFRIPLNTPDEKHGNIAGLQSTRFMRLFLTGFQDTSVTFRFATMQFIINQWRLFSNEIDTLGGLKPVANTATQYSLQTVNIEENERRTPVPYVMPPGVTRQSFASATAGALLQNEQSQAFVFDQLAGNQSRGVFKTVNYDFRNYDRISMFIHAEARTNNSIADGTLYAQIRLGDDAVNNYYEIRIPLKITSHGATIASDIWPSSNTLDLAFSALTQIKLKRDLSGTSPTRYFSEKQDNGTTIAIMGNPSIASISTILLAVYNANASAVSGQIWFDELKLAGLNEQPSWAMTGNVNIKIANFGNLNVSGSYKSIGWGSLEQRLGQRMLEDERQIGFSSDINLHQMLPDKVGLQMPLYISFTEIVNRPKFYPHASDLRLEEMLKRATDPDAILRMSLTYTEDYRISFPNVIFFKNTPKWFPLSPSLFTFNYTYSENFSYNPKIFSNSRTNHQGGVNYNYTVPIGELSPFKKLGLNSKYVRFIKEFNFRYLPSSIAFSISFDRVFAKRIDRNLDAFDGMNQPYFLKYFNFKKTLDVRWALTKSIQLSYSARQESAAEEPYGDLDTKQKQDSLWMSVWRLGKNNYFTHSFTGDYDVPFRLFPFLNWINGRLSYKATYSWKLNFVEVVGNNVQNTQTIGATLDLNFSELYLKSRSYRTITSSNSRSVPWTRTMSKTTLNILTMLKTLRINYTENLGTIIPGWAPNIETWGQSFSTSNPGWKFLLGYTPSMDWFRNTFIYNNWMISNTAFTESVAQTYKQNITVNANISPIRDLRIDISMRQDFTKNYNFQVQDVTGNRDFQINNPVSTGSFSVSFLSFTLFNGLSNSNLLDIANRLNQNRQTLSRRLSTANVYSTNVATGGYYEGYGPYSQDVLIPSFIAAFTNTSPERVPFLRHQHSQLRDNPFRGFFMLPNWTISYSGLTRIPAIRKIFNSLVFTHTYSSSLDMSNYTSSLKFADPYGAGWPSFIDPKSGNFIAYFLIPNVSITEQYNPLLGISGVIRNWQFSSSVKRTRQSTMSLSDYQISEANVFGVAGKLGWTSADIDLPFSLRLFSQKPSVANLTLSSDLNIENNSTQNIRMDEHILITSGGMDRINFGVTVGMIVDKMLNAQLYVEQLNTYPKLSTSPPVFITRFGLRLTLDINYQKENTMTDILPANGLGDRTPIDDIINRKKPK